MVFIAIASASFGAGVLRDFMDKIYNPSMTSKKEAIKMVESAELLKSIITEARDSTSDAESREIYELYIYDLTDYIFQIKYGTLVEYKTSRDPGIVTLRDYLGIPPPQGFAFVRTNCSPDERELSEGRAGVTYKKRYIKIVTNLKINDSGYAMGEDSEVLSHELIHSYIAASSPKYDQSYPKWFSEGCALYYAKDRYSPYAPYQFATMSRGLSQEYANYVNVFCYLARTKGTKTLDEFVVKSVKSKKLDSSVEDLTGGRDYEALVADSQWWGLGRGVFVFMFIFFVIRLILLWNALVSIPKMRELSLSYLQIKRKNEFAEEPTDRDIHLEGSLAGYYDQRYINGAFKKNFRAKLIWSFLVLLVLIGCNFVFHFIFV
jgi:hypothetical protein